MRIFCTGEKGQPCYECIGAGPPGPPGPRGPPGIPGKTTLHENTDILLPHSNTVLLVILESIKNVKLE